MDESTVKAFLRYHSAPIVDFAIGFYANLTWQEALAIELCGKKHMTQERAAEEAGYSVDAMQKWYRAGINKLCAAWQGLDWLEKIIS